MHTWGAFPGALLTNSMAGSTQQKSVPTAALAINDISAIDDGLDNISLTSTVDDDYSPDTEFVVEGIRAEKIINGVHMYLVEWSNFPLDQCTFEPEENLQDVLKAEWEENKLQQGPNVAEDFVKKYETAQTQKWEESRQRHRRRNVKRRKLGLNPTRFRFRGTYYPDSEDEADEATRSEDSESEDIYDSQDDLNAWKDSSESDEAEEDDQVDHKAAGVLVSTKPQTTPKPQPRANRIFSFNPSQAASKKAKKADTAAKESIQARNKGPISGPQPSPQSSRPRELPSSTGYQGSARKPTSTIVRERQTQIMRTSLPARPPRTPLPTRPLNAGPAKSVGKQIKARRTDLNGVNVFTGGSTRKKRTSNNAPEEPRFYPNASARRKSELKSRGREDDAPDIHKLPHVFTPGASTTEVQPSGLPEEVLLDRLASSNAARPVVQEIGAQAITNLPTQIKPPVRTVSESKSVLRTSKRGSLDSGRPAKRAKSVRFTEAYDEPTADREPRSIRFSGADERFERFFSEPMEIDEVTESPSETTFAPIAEDGANTMVPNNKHRARQDVSKCVTLVSSPSKTLEVIFNGMPKGPSGDDEPPWLKALLQIGCLCFGHTVLAETLMDQLRVLGFQGTEHLCSGIITSEVVEDQNALETVAEHLRIGRLGLFLAQKDFNVLLYPTKCDGFGLEAFGADPTSCDGISLKYFIFASSCPISRLIRPLTGNLDSSQKPLEVGQEMAILFTKILGVRLTRLGNGRHHAKPKQFFFAFPERAIEWQRSFCKWFYQRDSRCRIYTNFDPGSWGAFVEKATQEPGVIIIHESIIPFVRRFPGIWKLLQMDSCVWRFSESPSPQHAPSLQDSLGGLPDASVIPPMLSGIFSHGMAILVTPSFILSQPQEAYKLFKWFFRSQARVSYNKLVTAYNIRDYLHGLAADKSHQSRLFKETRWKRMAELDVRVEMNASGLNDDDVEASQRTWLEVDTWLQQQAEPHVPFSENNHVIYADASIDPNDEQSLVNWFGWWTLVRSDKYRKFYVIGSNSSDKDHAHPRSQLLPRMARDMKIPLYGPSVVNDPDACLRVSTKPSPNLSETSAARPGPERDRPAWFQSERYFQHGEGDIKEFLSHYDRSGFTRIFRYPVSYLDTTMADHFGDPRMACRTYKQWWDFPLPWLGDEFKKFNTYLGFFYTNQEDWVPGNFPKNLKPRRHPWVVIYRPVEPHFKAGGYKHGRNELIIWDVRAGYKLEENTKIKLADLTWMQQELIRYVQLHAHEKSPGSVLEKVWLGGFQVQQNTCSSTLPMDVTAEFFELVVNNIHDTVPSPKWAMYQKGYRPVIFSQASQTPLHTTAALNQGTDTRAIRAGCADKFSEDTRIIFHPPRGSATLRPTGTSVCTNDLFEASRLAKMHDPNAREMTFRYRPTLEWYRQQVAEGRQFEHIHVGGWVDIFKALDMNNDQGKLPSSATASEQSLRFSRRSSSSSNRGSPKP